MSCQRKARAKRCAAGPSADLPTRMQSPPYRCRHPWSATDLGGEMQRREAWRVSQPQERCSPCLPFSLVPWRFTRADVRLQFVQDFSGLSSNRSPCTRLVTCCVKEQGWGNPTEKLGEAAWNVCISLSECAAGFGSRRLISVGGK